MTRSTLLAALAVCTFSASAETTAAAAPAKLSTVVVTASRAEQSSEQLSAATVIIDRAQIELAQANDLAELLRFTAGFDIGRNGGPGQTTSLFVRGGNSNHTLVLIDGVPINNATTGAAALQHIAPAMIERIEVIKGPRASLYGSSAIAAVVNVITRRADQASGQLQASLGAHNASDLSAQGAFVAENGGRLNLLLQRQRSDGIPPVRGSTLGGDYQLRTVQMQGEVPVASALLSAQLWHAEGSVGYTDLFTGSQDLHQETRNRSIRSAVSGKLSEHWSSELALSDAADRVQQRESPDYADTRRSGIAWQNQFSISPQQQLSLGAGYSREQVDSLSFGARVEESRDIREFSAEYLLHAARYSLQANLSGIDHDAFGDQLLWNLELGHDLLDSLRLFALAGTGFRAPSALDRFGFGGNPELDAESSRSLEAGLRWQPSDAWRNELRLFETLVDDLVSFDPSRTSPANPFGSLANIERARIQGLEISSQWQNGSWLAQFSGTLQDPENQTTGATLLRRAKQSAALRFSRKLGHHQLGLNLLASGPRDDFGSELGGYALLNLSAQIQLQPGLLLQARLENALDKDYQTAAGYRHLGATAQLGLNWTLQ